MPSKTSKTTRKHGTVTRIQLYADEQRCLDNAFRILESLAGHLGTERKDAQELLNIACLVASAGDKYTDYQDNGEAGHIDKDLESI